MPAQQRVRRHQPAHPQRSREQPGQGSDHRPVGPVQLRFGVLPPQHRHLLAQHQQLGVLRCRRTRQQRHPAGQADEDQVEHPYGHKPAILPAQRPSRQSYSQVSSPMPRFGTQQACPALGAARPVSPCPAHKPAPGIKGELAFDTQKRNRNHKNPLTGSVHAFRGLPTCESNWLSTVGQGADGAKVAIKVAVGDTV